MKVKTGNVKKYHLLGLQKDELLYESLIEYCRQNQIGNGSIQIIGSLQKLNIAFYDQVKKEYVNISRNETVEIVNATGDISTKDGQIFVHVHLAVSTRDTKVFGGHLLPESPVFAAEVTILEFEGEPFVRKFDPETGLFIWNS